MTYQLVSQDSFTRSIDFKISGHEQTLLRTRVIKESHQVTPQQLAQKLIEACLADYLQSEKLGLWRLPKIENVNVTPSQLSFRCILTLFPPVQLPESDQVTIDVPELIPPSEKELEQALMALQFHFHHAQPVNRPADWGDLISVSMYGQCLGQLMPGSAQKDYSVVLKPSVEKDSVMEGMVGMSLGEKKSIALTLPDNYPYPAWRGQKAEYHLVLHSCQAIKIPPLDESLALHAGFASLESLAEQVYQDLLKTHNAQWQAQIRRIVTNAYVEGAEVEIPDEWVRESLIQDWQQTDFQALKQQKAPLPAPKESYQSWLQQPHLWDLYRSQLKTQFVLHALVLKHQLPLPKEEILKFLAGFSGPDNATPEAIYEDMSANGSLAELTKTLRLEKAVDYLMERAKLRHQGKEYTVPA